MNRRYFLILGAITSLGLAQILAAVPLMTGYQGRVQVDETDFTGNGQFKFALIGKPDGDSLWSNDGTSVNGSEPATAITLPVQGGVFSVFLGDPTLLNMQPLTADMFTANPEVSLRIWFNDGIHGSIQLTPDVRLGSVPYALSANVAPGSITSGQLAPAAIDPAKLASANTPQIGQLLSYDGTGFNWTDISTIGTTWALNGADTYYTAGRVGIGLSAPAATLHVQSSRAGGSDNTASFYNPSLGPNASHIHYGPAGDWYIRSAKNTGKVILQDTGGHVGIGTSSPVAPLEVTADWLVNGPNIQLSGPNPTIAWVETADPNIGATRHSWFAHLGASSGLEFWHREGPGGIGPLQIKTAFTTDGGLWYAGRLDKLDTSEQASATIRAADLNLGHSGRRGTPGRALVDAGNALHLNYNADWAETVIGGKITCQEDASVRTLTIRGGADLAEPFRMPETIAKGAVVVIDEENPGELKLSTQAYDTRVAGIVSGANGVNPGIALHQEGALEGGQNVALSGRVYVQADAQEGAIKPGDLLTTSHVPGHAMRVTDHVRAQGAILGKAMSGLKEGQGMVLVLVTLQ